MAEPQLSAVSAKAVTPVTPVKPEAVPPAGATPPAGNAALRTRLILGCIVVVAVLIGARMWWRGHYFEETDNAYLDGNVTIVSPRIAGTVGKVLVKDNQRIQAGELLVELDPADHQIKVDQILAQIAQVDAQIAQVNAQVEQAQAETASTEAQVARTTAQSTRAQTDAERYTSLYAADAKAVSRQEVDTALATRDSASSDLRAQNAQVLASRAKMASVQSSRLSWQAQKKVLEAQLQDARLQLGYNKLIAPVSGRVGKKNIEVGGRIQPGQQVLAIVQDGVWITANFKETQLAGLVPGQQAHVRIDAIPGQHFTGHVESFAPASGAHFSLLPPDNATGNFTKIVQRIPVKIMLDPASAKAFSERLAPGMSAVVEIDLRQAQPASSGNAKVAANAAVTTAP